MDNDKNKVACIGAENIQSEISIVLSPEEKKEKLLAPTKELSDKSDVIELYEKIAQLKGGSIENNPLTIEEREKIAQLKEHRKKSESQHSHKATNYKGDRFDLAQVGVYAATGSPDLSFGLSIIKRCVQAASIGQNDDHDRHYDSIVNALNSLKPENEIEGMLTSRMIALHAQSMYYLACAANNESSTQSRDLNINRSAKLMRVYNETLETLMRYRRKGEQKFTVQHVNVENGGQAVVMGGGAK